MNATMSIVMRKINTLNKQTTSKQQKIRKPEMQAKAKKEVRGKQPQLSKIKVKKGWRPRE